MRHLALIIAPTSSHPRLLSYELIDLVWRLSPISLLVEPCVIPLVQYHAHNTVNASTVSPISISADKRQKKKKKKKITKPGLICLSADDGVDCASNSAGLRHGRQADAMGNLLWA
jgi:hypothetical protein